jgi:hypothetical protein
MTHTTADNSPAPFTKGAQRPKMPLGYRLAWRLLGWGFEREDGFWIADAYLQDIPYCSQATPSKRAIWWEDGTLNVWLRRGKLEVSIEPRHVVRMVWLMKVVTLIAASIGLGWWLRG